MGILLMQKNNSLYNVFNYKCKNDQTNILITCTYAVN